MNSKDRKNNSRDSPLYYGDEYEEIKQFPSYSNHVTSKIYQKLGELDLSRIKPPVEDLEKFPKLGPMRLIKDHSVYIG